MPELPEVETTLRGIAPLIADNAVKRVVVRDARLRWPVPAGLNRILRDRPIGRLWRRGKYLLMAFEHGHLMIHLGMSGSLLLVEAGRPPGKHDHVDIVLSEGRVLRYSDPRRFGSLLWLTGDPLQSPQLRHLGREPLDEAFDAPYLEEKCLGRRIAIKSLIMDSRTVVGIGNIYANEALYACGLLPDRPAGEVDRREIDALVKAIKQILLQALAQGGTTLRDFVASDGRAGYFKHELQVYGRGGLPCNRCGNPLLSVRLGQRSTVYCRQCQK